MTFCQLTIYQRWSEYNTNVLEYSTITLNKRDEYSEKKCTRVRFLFLKPVRVRLL
ncbi:hypothetical protein NP493_193g01042 [Ridgeia piscesae]|uniref:Uncharacterized protein n=1 Tax=Ridgeia piscesae TaxID=27915 RepID=A0AAD9P271_RIDPI|nr:hypothetical protein NP493_193g01042 [Ridgeia piscesae]